MKQFSEKVKLFFNANNVLLSLLIGLVCYIYMDFTARQEKINESFIKAVENNRDNIYNINSRQDIQLSEHDIRIENAEKNVEVLKSDVDYLKFDKRKANSKY